MSCAHQTVYFNECVIDVSCRDVFRKGVRQQTEPMVFDLILYLVEHRNRVVSRSELFKNIWQDRIVSEATLSSRIKAARKVLSDNGRNQEVIRTYYGRGFRFVADARCTECTPREPLADVVRLARKGSGGDYAQSRVALY
ncbi:MAG: transcriptional regulator [Pseudomonadota bacterium]